MNAKPALSVRFLSLVLSLVLANAAYAATPKVGESAPDFTLRTLDEKSVSLHDLAAKQTVVLVVLRGWPGYQCPICTKQVHDFSKAAPEFAKLNAKVLMVYPGPAEKLKEHAREFLESKQWPKDFLYVMDPDYTFTEAYGLRWNAPRETAYPSTFVIDQKNRVRFALISKTHGGRASVEDVLKALREL